MSKPRVIKVTFIDPYESDDSGVDPYESDDSGVDPDYMPSQTPESEDYSSLESSQYSVSSSQYSETDSSDQSSLD